MFQYIADLITYNLFKVMKTPSEDLVCTALLHDAVEDSKLTKEEVAKKVGRQVAENVDMLTKKGNKMEYLKNMKAASKDVKTIKILDRISNATSLQAWSEKGKERYRKETMVLLNSVKGHPLEKKLDETVKRVWKQRRLR